MIHALLSFSLLLASFSLTDLPPVKKSSCYIFRGYKTYPYVNEVITHYDRQSRLLSREYLTKDSLNDYSALERFYYRDTLLVAKVMTYGSGVSTKWTYTYDDNHRLISQEYWEADSSTGAQWKELCKRTFEYDSLGRKAKIVEEPECGGSVFTFQYDSLGRMTNENRYDADGKLVATTEFVYRIRVTHTIVKLHEIDSSHQVLQGPFKFGKTVRGYPIYQDLIGRLWDPSIDHKNFERYYVTAAKLNPWDDVVLQRQYDQNTELLNFTGYDYEFHQP